MIRFVVRNYGVTRQVPYKGQQVIIANDKAIETDDMELVAILQNVEAMYVTDRCPGTPGPSLPPIVKTEDKQTSEAPKAEAPKASDEIEYKEMTYKELQILGKDRQMKTVGVSKEKLIEGLENYDKEETSETSVVEPEVVEKVVLYSEMTVPKLQVLAKGKQIKVSGLNKAKLIKALKRYDKKKKLAS